ncbi:MAG: SLBB domain-containing protein, partial [Proteobacteria bacterium]|nr:SLBB domain-containing protein [Pseudomonadota bacterium]
AGAEADGNFIQQVTSTKLKLQGGSPVALNWAIDGVRKGGTVSVVGEVLSPGAFSMNAGSGLKEFIRLAGGTTKDADDGRAYVVGPDGLAQPLSRFGGHKLRDGDTVVVPTDLKKLPPLPAWAAVTQILSNMVITAAAIKRF